MASALPPPHNCDSALELLIEMHGAPFACLRSAIEYGLSEVMTAPNDELAELMLEPVIVLMSELDDVNHYIARLELELRQLQWQVFVH